MPGETLASGQDKDYLLQTVGGWESLSIEALLADIIEHIEHHLTELRAGSYGHILPAGCVEALIEYNERLLEDFKSPNIGNMSNQALIARFYACNNEESDYLNGLRLAD